MSQIEKSPPQPPRTHHPEIPPEPRTAAEPGSRTAAEPGSRTTPAGRTEWRRDLSASVVVFLLAVPLSLGVALATGAPLQAGLVAAAVGGIVAGLLGGVPLQVSGAATGLLAVTADLVQRYGWRATCAVTVLAGLVQLALGALRVARATSAVSPAVVHGLLAGIGVTIAVGQLHVVLGGSPDGSALDNAAALPGQLAHPHATALLIGAVTVAVLIGWGRLPGRAGRWARILPAPLDRKSVV